MPSSGVTVYCKTESSVTPDDEIIYRNKSIKLTLMLIFIMYHLIHLGQNLCRKLAKALGDTL
jgi:hypothetical protein